MAQPDSARRPALMGGCMDAIANDLCSQLFRDCGRQQPTPASPEVDATSAAIEKLLDEFQVKHGGLTIIDAAAEAFRKLAEIPHILRWDEGLRAAVHDLVLATVHEAERFGDGTGAFKRRFSVDTVTRVLRGYDTTGLIEPVEDVLVSPFVGIQIDWIVQALNIHDAWKPVDHVALPKFFQGRYGNLLRLNAWLWHAWVVLRELVFFPSRYERELRDARRNIDAEVQALYGILPTSSSQYTAELLVNVVAKVGNLTAPHVQTIDSLWRLTEQLGRMSVADREEVVIRAATLLLRRAYADDDLALSIFDSAIGQFLIRQMVFSTEWVLARNGLLPNATLA
ncbi:MAG: hypothetical protein JWM26_3441 [Betaproteobacteria bacterium]|nr:hypothetical protein [Betaproteobacteria bacterium]